MDAVRKCYSGTVHFVVPYLIFIYVTSCLSYFISGAQVASDHEERLLIDLFRDYNNLVRPVQSMNDSPITVEFGMAMILLINVDEKNQIMQTNVWLTLKWPDYQVRWNPYDYGRITTIRVPPDKVCADGKYEVSFHSNVVVDYNGSMLWVPPAIYKSSCTINVEYFPFDEQRCYLVFGSWTYNSQEVQLDWYNGKDQVELNDYSFSGIWDIMEVPGILEMERRRITFTITIRRKTLFYTVILIIPTILMAFLSMMVFYLPADASEKITLAISILLALVVFLLLVSKILPPTSTTIPLMAKYLLLTFVMNIVTILVTVIIINIYFRGPTTHRMPAWAKSLFLEILPRFLLMRRPRRIPLLIRPYNEETEQSSAQNCMPPVSTDSWMTDRTSMELLHRQGRHEFDQENPYFGYQPSQSRTQHHPNCRLSSENLRTTSFIRMENIEFENRLRSQATSHRRRNATDAEIDHPIDTVSSVTAQSSDTSRPRRRRQLEERFGQDAYKAIAALEYITEHLKQLDNYKKVRDDWKYAAMVIDRLLLYVFFGVTAGGTLLILLSAPNVFQYIDQADVIDRIKAKYPTFI